LSVGEVAVETTLPASAGTAIIEGTLTARGGVGDRPCSGNRVSSAGALTCYAEIIHFSIAVGAGGGACEGAIAVTIVGIGGSASGIGGLAVGESGTAIEVSGVAVAGDYASACAGLAVGVGGGAVDGGGVTFFGSGNCGSGSFTVLTSDRGGYTLCHS